jgi:Spy/CpxP family protein refolding chaperone
MKVVSRLGFLVIVAIAVVSINSVANAQPGRGGRGFGGGGFFGGQSNGLDLLNDENVRRELDLVDDQVTKLREVQQRIGEEMRSAFEGFDFQGLRDLSEEEREAKFAPIREKMEKVNADIQKDIDQVLLPQQRQRLKEIVVQSQIRRQGTSGALSGGALATELNITEEQKEKLRAKQAEVEEELRKETEQLRLEARDKILSVLTAEQRAKLNALMGKPIEFQQFGGFGGGGFGGPGGRGGAGGRGPGGPGGAGGAGGGRIQRDPAGD